MLDVVLTGPIGAGKSAVASLLEKAGIEVIDADGISRELTAQGGSLVPAIDQAFPGVVTDGVIDRSQLASIVFNDPDALARLNSLTHPVVGAEIARRKAESSSSLVVTDIPLIVEQGRGSEPAVLIVVDADEETRRQRLKSTRGMSDEDITARMEAQATRGKRNSFADILIDNNGSIEELTAAVETLTQRLTSFARAYNDKTLVEGRKGDEIEMQRVAKKIEYHGAQAAIADGKLQVTVVNDEVLRRAGFVYAGRWQRPDPLAVIEAEVLSPATVA